jgi:uncharacterized protein YjbI with pentapeptide repeats
MANPEHVELLLRGVSAWNDWRRARPSVRPDLSSTPTSELDRDVHALANAILQEVAPGNVPTAGSDWDKQNLSQVDLSGADLRGAVLDGAVLVEADLAGADLRDASLVGCVLTGAKLMGARAEGVNLMAATLRWADLTDTVMPDSMLRLANLDQAVARGTDLRRADLFYASLVGADLREADLRGAFVYGISAWDIDLTDAQQNDMVITKATDPPVAVDDLLVAQFLHTLIRNRTIRSMIDTITTKVVVILGRFTPRRKQFLDTIRTELRQRGYVPIIFDFERPASRDFGETVVTLAHLARFIVADLTEPASVPKELEAIVPDLAVPVVPLLEEGNDPYAMFLDYWKYDWVLPVLKYSRVEDVSAFVESGIVRRAERKAAELNLRRVEALGGRGDAGP